MTRPLILSDTSLKPSDESQGSFRHGLTRTTTPAGTRCALDRAGDARHVERDIQTLRSAQLPLCQRPGPRTQALSVRQPSRQLAAQRLRTQCRLWPRRPVHQQLAQAAQYARRNLRDQYRADAAPRRSWIDRDGSCVHPVRPNTGGCHSCRHGCGLSRRRPAACCGGEA